MLFGNMLLIKLSALGLEAAVEGFDSVTGAGVGVEMSSGRGVSSTIGA